MRCKMVQMQRHTGTLTELIEGEHQKTLKALERYGANFAHNLKVFQLLEGFFTDVKAPQDIFLRFYFSFRNFYWLTLFSIIRLHHVQSSLNLRQMIEYGTDAAYAIVFPEVEKFADTDEFGIMDSTQPLKSKRYKWLDENYKATSQAILKIKSPVQVSSHSNISDTNRGYKFVASDDSAQIHVSFFDFEDDYMEKAALWQLANTTLAILGLWYEISRDYKTLELIPDFAQKHATLMQENQQIKSELTATDRFKQADNVAKARDGGK